MRNSRLTSLFISWRGKLRPREGKGISPKVPRRVCGRFPPPASLHRIPAPHAAFTRHTKIILSVIRQLFAGRARAEAPGGGGEQRINHLVEFAYLWGQPEPFEVTAAVNRDECCEGNRQGDETEEAVLDRVVREVLTTTIIRKTGIRPASESRGG